jgi:hypothetical protein
MTAKPGKSLALAALRAFHTFIVTCMGGALVLTLAGVALEDAAWGQVLIGIVAITVFSNLVNKNRCPLTDIEHDMLGTYEDHAHDRRFSAALAERLGIHLDGKVYDALFYIIGGIVIAGVFL